MSELQPAGRIPDRIDLAIGGLQRGIDLHPGPIGLHPRRLEPEIVGIGLAPDRDQKMRALMDRPVSRRHRNAIPRGPDALRALLLDDHDALAPQPLQRNRRKLRIVLAECARALDHRHPAAEPAMRLRHLHADRPAADDDQVCGRSRSPKIVSLV